MMMLIIFLITDISMVGIFAGVYGNIAKYREGMLMGVHIPKSELEHPDVKELLQLYKKRNRQFYLWNMLAGIAVCLLCFTYFSIFITVWTLWFVEFCLLTILRVYHYHQKVYDIKQKNGWISSANADVSAAVDTRTSSQIAKKILPAKLHLIPAAVILTIRDRNHIGNIQIRSVFFSCHALNLSNRKYRILFCKCIIDLRHNLRRFCICLTIHRFPAGKLLTIALIPFCT